jgi:hypothetical protein
MVRTSGSGEAALAAFEAACAEQQHAAARRSQTIGLGVGAAASFAKAADSAIELHTMCHRASDGNKQQQQQHAEGNYNPFEAHERQLQQHLAANNSLSAVSAPIAAAASGPGSGALLLQNSSIASGNGSSYFRGFGLGGSNARINSRTALLGLGGAPDSAGGCGAAVAAAQTSAAAYNKTAKGGKGKTKLSSVAHGAATAAGSAGASCAGDLEVKEEVVPHRGCFGAFMRNHPLLVHITAVQLKVRCGFASSCFHMLPRLPSHVPAYCSTACRPAIGQMLLDVPCGACRASTCGSMSWPSCFSVSGAASTCNLQHHISCFNIVIFRVVPAEFPLVAQRCGYCPQR